MQMDDFDRFLDAQLARMLGTLVRTPAPRRSRHWRDGPRGRLRTLNGGANEAPRSKPPPEVFPVVAVAAIGLSSSSS